MKQLSALGRGLLRFMQLLGLSVVLVAGAGAVYAAVAGSGLRSSIASALFIAGGVLVIANSFAGGGGRGRRADSLSRQARRAPAIEMPFAWVLIGLCLIGIGVLVVVA